MSGIIEAKTAIKKIYSSYEAYINPILKFLLSFIILSVINGKIGYMGKIDNIVIVLILALACSFLPLGITAAIAGVFILLHMYALGIECALVTAVVFILMFLLYARFVPNETIVVLITPILFFLKMPYVMPIAMGLIGGPLSIISVSFGVIVAYLVDYISTNASTLTTMEDGNLIARVRFIVDGIAGNKEMIFMVIAFAITLMTVYAIRRRSIDHSWTIATFAGVVTDLVFLLFSAVALGLDYSIAGIFFGSIIAGAIGMFLQFFNFHLDYQRVENLQFEDDEYYYYVKAIPKFETQSQTKKTRRPAPAAEAARTRSTSAHSGQSHNREGHSGSGTRTVHTANGASRTVRR